MFYDRFLELCAEKGVKPTNACIEAGLSRGLAAKWKSTKTEKPSAEALEKMSVYFEKSIDEILGKQKVPTLESGHKRKLRSVSRLESANITPELDKNIADYIDYLLSKKERGE